MQSVFQGLRKLMGKDGTVAGVTLDPNFAPDDIPDVAWTEAFKRCDHNSLKKLKLVCRRFYGLLHDPLLWIDLCERDGKNLPPLALRNAILEVPDVEENADIYLDYEAIWVRDPYRDNLAPPLMDQPTTFERMMRDHRVIFHNDGGEGMKVEEPPEFLGEQRDDIPRAIATSYGWGRRLVQIDLIREGVQPWVLDKLRPRIVVSEYATARKDCGSIYQMHAQLLTEGEQFDDSSFLPQRFRKEERKWPQWGDAVWEKVEIIFEDYPAGVRSIGVLSSGRDTQFWAGHYGSKFAKLEIRIELPNELRLLPWDTFPDGEKSMGDGPAMALHGRHLSHRFPPPHAAGIRGRIIRRL